MYFRYASLELVSGRQQKDTFVRTLRWYVNTSENAKTQKISCCAMKTQTKADDPSPEQSILSWRKYYPKNLQLVTAGEKKPYNSQFWKDHNLVSSEIRQGHRSSSRMEIRQGSQRVIVQIKNLHAGRTVKVRGNQSFAGIAFGEIQGGIS